MKQPSIYECFIYKNNLIRFWQIDNILYYEILNLLYGNLIQEARHNDRIDTATVIECFKTKIDFEERTIV